MTTAASHARRRRRLRSAGIIALALVALVAGAFWLLTRSWFLAGRLRPELERRLGGAVAIGEVSYEGSGRFRVENLTLRSRAHRGLAAEVLSIRTAMLQLNPSNLLEGRVRIEQIELDGVLLRLSEDARTNGAFSIMGLRPRWPAGGDDEPPPPDVRIRNATIEVGVHDGSRYERVGRRVVTGEMSPLPEQGWFHFGLRELDQFGHHRPGKGIDLSGRWNPLRNELHSQVTGLRLDATTYDMCPAIVRLWWDQMELEGVVADASVKWGGDRDLSVRFSVRDVGLTLPIEPGAFWVRYRDGEVVSAYERPRMRVTSGTLLLQPDRLQLVELEGEIRSAAAGREMVGVPYRVTLDLEALPELDWNDRGRWLNEVLEQAPFTMKVDLDHFDLRDRAGTNAPAVGLPVQVARMLERFAMADWQISASVQARREAGGTITTSGTVDVHDGRGAYEKFPYLLENIEARMHFDNDELRIEWLEGDGSAGAVVSIDGMITPLDRDAEVSLNIRTTAAPIDGRLRDALRGPSARLFDMLLHQPSLDALTAAGLLPYDPGGAMDEARRRLDQALDELGTSPPGPEADVLRRRLEVGRRVLARQEGPRAFDLEGRIDLDLQVRRERGPGNPVLITGEVAARTVSMLFEHFPYPVTVVDGVLDWNEHAITIRSDEAHPGLSVVTPGGGYGVIEGVFHVQREGERRRLRPELTVAVMNDRISPLLEAAIPPPRDLRRDEQGMLIWPGATLSSEARLLREVRLDGPLSYRGRIATADDGKVGFHFDVDLAGGSAMISPELLQRFTARELSWMEGWTLGDVRGELTVSDSGVELKTLEGRRDECLVSVSGGMSRGDDTDGRGFRIDMSRVPFSPETLRSVAGGGDPPGWMAYQPRGEFDARIELDLAGGRLRAGDLSLLPRFIDLAVAGSTVRLARTEGRIAVSDSGLDAEDLAFRVVTDGRPDGAAVLQGPLDSRPAGGELTATMTGGRIQCPLIGEAVRQWGGAAARTALERHRPRGLFDGQIVLGRTHDDRPPHFSCILRPRALGIDVRDRWLELRFDPSSRLLIEPGRVRLEQLRGILDGGRFALDGTVDTGETLRTDLVIDYRGRFTSTGFGALVPREAAALLEAIGFDDGDLTAGNGLQRCRLRLERSADGAGDPAWRSSFTGALLLDGASFDAGVRLEDVRGRFDIDLRLDPDLPAYLAVAADLDEFSAMGERVTDIRAGIDLDAAASRVRISGLRGDFYDGLLTAEADVGIGSRRGYSATVNVVGAAVDRVIDDDAAADPDAVPPGDAPGRIFASVALSGRRGELESRRGRGQVRVLGPITDVPAMLKVMQLAYGTWPGVGDLGYAESTFYIAGRRLTFERLLLESVMGDLAPMRLIGEGTMDLQAFEVDTRFRQRGGWPVVGELIGGIGDGLYVIEVTGPARDPDVNVIALPGLNPPPRRSSSASDS